MRQNSEAKLKNGEYYGSNENLAIQSELFDTICVEYTEYFVAEEVLMLAFKLILL